MIDGRPWRPDRPLIWSVVFVVLLVLVVLGALDRLDLGVLHFVEHHRDHSVATGARRLTRVVSPPVDAAVLAFGAAAIARRTRSRRPALVAAAFGALVAVVVLGVKAAVGRPAPRLGLQPAHGGSFPSGHTAAVLVCAGILVLLTTAHRPRLRRRLLAAVAALTVLVAAALVYDGYHWLSDTVASAALGIAILCAARGRVTRQTE